MSLQGACTPQDQKKASSPPPALASKRKTEFKKSASSSSAGSASSSSPRGSTDSTLSKAGSSSSLKSLGSSSRAPPKVTPRGASSSGVKKSDSQLSLKKPNATTNGQSSTAARCSPSAAASNVPSANSASPPCKPLSVPGGKKPAVSKIAGLWRKDKKAGAQTSAKAPVKNTTMDKTKTKTKDDNSASKDSVPRSSTYDKLSSESGSISSGGDTISAGQSSPVEEKKPPPVPPRSLWRRTYTVDQEETKSIDIPIEPAAKSVLDQPKAATLPAVKSPPDEDSKKDAKKEGHKKRFSWWRKEKDPELKKKQQQSGSKIPAPGGNTSKKQETKPPKGRGVWVTIDGTISLKDPVAERKTDPVPNGFAKQAAAIKSPVSAVSEYNILQVRERVQQTSMAEKPNELDVKPVALSGSPITSPTRGNTPANAAIVPPFNYNPSQKMELTQDEEGSTDSVTKPMTKTEMLIARRRQSYLNSLTKTNEGEVNEGGNGKGKKTSCLVTTV